MDNKHFESSNDSDDDEEDDEEYHVKLGEKLVAHTIRSLNRFGSIRCLEELTMRNDDNLTSCENLQKHNGEKKLQARRNALYHHGSMRCINPPKTRDKESNEAKKKILERHNPIYHFGSLRFIEHPEISDGAETTERISNPPTESRSKSCEKRGSDDSSKRRTTPTPPKRFLGLPTPPKPCSFENLRSALFPQNKKVQSQSTNNDSLDDLKFRSRHEVPCKPRSFGYFRFDSVNQKKQKQPSHNAVWDDCCESSNLELDRKPTSLTDFHLYIDDNCERLKLHKTESRRRNGLTAYTSYEFEKATNHHDDYEIILKDDEKELKDQKLDEERKEEKELLQLRLNMFGQKKSTDTTTSRNGMARKVRSHESLMKHW
jgi:hypothetical protein